MLAFLPQPAPEGGGARQKTGRRRMGRMEEAEARLDRALARLEAATTRQGSASSSELEQELACVKARCETLETRSREVSDRLDAAIARLHAILGNSNGAG